MADNNPYSIVGAGKTNKNPIETFIDCGESAATVCWVGRLSMPVGCVDGYRDEKICSAITVTPSTTESKFDWNCREVYYKVISGECPTSSSATCSGECSDLDVYVVPSTVPSGYSGSVDVYYSYYLTNLCDDGTIEDRVYKSGVTGIPFSTDSSIWKYTYQPEGLSCTGGVEVYVTSGDTCESGDTIDISLLFNPSYVPAEPSSGTDVDINVQFRRVILDDECNRKVINGQFPLKWHIKCTSGSSDEKSSSEYKFRCCDDHYVSGETSVDEIFSAVGADKTTAKIYYNGALVSESAITYSILQKGKTTEECSGLCQERTTYCVDQSSVKVYYEVGGYMSDVWELDSGCSITSPASIECGSKPTFEATTSSGGNLKVPSTGGRIKVTWNYSAHTITDDCYEFDSSGGTWEEIITIGGCDERPTKCKEDDCICKEYNKVVINRQGTTATYDDDTYGDCQICDSECCYDYDGQGTCRCVILFKEQTSGCTTCDSCDVWDDEEKRLITYNKIRYQFKQTCDTNCQEFTTYTYEKKEGRIDKCGENGLTITGIKYTATTQYIGVGCDAPKTVEGTTSVTINAPGTNESDKEKVIRDDDLVKVVQAARLCHNVLDCRCEDLTITDGYKREIAKEKDKTITIGYTLDDKYCDGTAVVTASTDADWLTVVSVSNGVITIKTTKYNCGGDRTTYVIPILNGNSCDERKVEVKQKGESGKVIKPETINCGDKSIFTLE